MVVRQAGVRGTSLDPSRLVELHRLLHVLEALAGLSLRGEGSADQIHVLIVLHGRGDS